MATDTLTAQIPELELQPGMQVVFEAISPTTGAAVVGVTVSAIALFGLDRGGAASGAFAPFTLVNPTLLHKA